MEKRLTDDEIIKLKEIHKTLKYQNDADKIKCLVLWGEGWKWEDITQALLISEHYIEEVVKKYKDGGNKKLLQHNWKGNNIKMTKDQNNELSEYLEKNIMRTTNQICDYISQKYQIKYTEEWMAKKLHKLGFTYKKPKRLPAKIPDEKVQREKIEEMNGIMNKLKENEAFFFADGSGFEHNTKIDYGWIKKGKDKMIKTNTGRQRINVNGAYNPISNEVVSIETEESMNQNMNIELVKKLIEKNPKINVFNIALDNAKYNYGKKFQEYIEEIKREQGIEIKLYYIPSYAPNLNLIERLWKYAKSKLLSNQYYEKYIDFKNTIIDFFENKIKNKEYQTDLKTYIGINFQIISPLIC